MREEMMRQNYAPKLSKSRYAVLIFTILITVTITKTAHITRGTTSFFLCEIVCLNHFIPFFNDSYLSFFMPPVKQMAMPFSRHSHLFDYHFILLNLLVFFLLWKSQKSKSTKRSNQQQIPYSDIVRVSGLWCSRLCAITTVGWPTVWSCTAITWWSWIFVC